MTNCDVMREALQADLDGVERPPELVDHLAACAACRSYAAGLERVAAAFAAAPRERAPAELLDRLGLAEPVAPVVVRRPGLRWPLLAGGLVAAGLVVAVGLAAKPDVAPTPWAVAPSPRQAAAEADAEAILTWFGPEADPVDVFEP